MIVTVLMTQHYRNVDQHFDLHRGSQNGESRPESIEMSAALVYPSAQILKSLTVKKVDVGTMPIKFDAPFLLWNERIIA